MPTILKSLKLEKIEEIIKILNDVKNGHQASVEELLILKKAFNPSLVGTSKLLHFINPEKYVIWDSRVFRFLNPTEAPHKYKLEKPETYIQYLTFINALKTEKTFDNFYTLMKEKVNFDITMNRAIELAFFLSQRDRFVTKPILRHKHYWPDASFNSQLRFDKS